MHLSCVLLWGILIICCYSGSYNKVLLKDQSALCLDGSPGAYYISQGQQKNKFLLYFQGGGWCGANTLQATYQSCYYRSSTGLGSSLGYPEHASYGGILSSDDNNNSFKNWTKVFLSYCDGSGHQGSRNQPISYKGKKLYFRGSNITLAQFDSIEQKYGLFTNSTDIMVSGGSAGGLAAFLWVDYVKSKAKSALVHGVPDSGIFLDSINLKTQNHTYRQQFQNLFKLSNLETNPPISQCIKQYPNERHMCMFAQNIYKYIKSPIYPIQSLYDSWSIPNILGINCVFGFFTSLQKCSSQQMDYIEEYHKNTSTLLTQITKNKQNGCWAPICSNHLYTVSSRYYNQDYRIPMKSSNSVDATLSSWINKKDQQNNIHIDNGKWPENTPCSGVSTHLRFRN